MARRARRIVRLLFRRPLTGPWGPDAGGGGQVGDAFDDGGFDTGGFD